MSLFNLFKRKDMSAEIKNYLEKGAVVVDVRTQEEWNEGHSKEAKHVVLHTIPLKIQELKSLKKPIITVCKSGGRSAQAAQFLAKEGVDVINGGPWQQVDRYL